MAGYINPSVNPNGLPGTGYQDGTRPANQDAAYYAQGGLNSGAVDGSIPHWISVDNSGVPLLDTLRASMTVEEFDEIYKIGPERSPLNTILNYGKQSSGGWHFMYTVSHQNDSVDIQVVDKDYWKPTLDDIKNEFLINAAATRIYLLKTRSGWVTLNLETTVDEETEIETVDETEGAVMFSSVEGEYLIAFLNEHAEDTSVTIGNNADDTINLTISGKVDAAADPTWGDGESTDYSMAQAAYEGAVADGKEKEVLCVYEITQTGSFTGAGSAYYDGAILKKTDKQYIFLPKFASKAAFANAVESLPHGGEIEFYASDAQSVHSEIGYTQIFYTPYEWAEEQELLKNERTQFNNGRRRHEQIRLDAAYEHNLKMELTWLIGGRLPGSMRRGSQLGHVGDGGTSVNRFVSSSAGIFDDVNGPRITKINVINTSNNKSYMKFEDLSDFIDLLLQYSRSKGIMAMGGKKVRRALKAWIVDQFHGYWTSVYDTTAVNNMMQRADVSEWNGLSFTGFQDYDMPLTFVHNPIFDELARWQSAPTVPTINTDVLMANKAVDWRVPGNVVQELKNNGTFDFDNDLLLINDSAFSGPGAGNNGMTLMQWTPTEIRDNVQAKNRLAHQGFYLTRQGMKIVMPELTFVVLKNIGQYKKNAGVV